MTNWEMPKENSIDALRHGIQFSDGVELDLRMDGEGELVIFHDEFISGNAPIKDRCVEVLSTSELKSSGVVEFEELLADKRFTEEWQGGGKTVDIEVKLTHKMSKICLLYTSDDADD